MASIWTRIIFNVNIWDQGVAITHKTHKPQDSEQKNTVYTTVR